MSLIQREPNPWAFPSFPDGYILVPGRTLRFKAEVEGLEAGGTKQAKLWVSGTYNNSIGGNSVNLNDDADPEPSLVPRRRRLMGQKKAKASSSGSAEVQSSSAASDLSPSVKIQATKHLFDMVSRWVETTDVVVKKEYALVIQTMKRNMGLPIDGDAEDVGDAAWDDGEDSDE